MSSLFWRKVESSAAARTPSCWPGTRGTGSCTRSICSSRSRASRPEEEPAPVRKQALPAAVCLDGFPRDPDFPQLETATDPRVMLQVFRRHLKPVPGKAYRIEECVPFRFRCRQSTSRCVLQYTLRVADSSSGRRWDQWVTGVVYAAAGEAERLWRGGGPRAPAPGLPGRGAAARSAPPPPLPQLVVVGVA